MLSFIKFPIVLEINEVARGDLKSNLEFIPVKMVSFFLMILLKHV